MSMCDCNQGRLKCTCKSEPINYGQLDPQQRLDVARGVATDSARLPVVGGELEACVCGSSDSSVGYESPQCYWVECGDCGRKTQPESSRSLAIYAWNTRKLTDAQALIAEKDAELQRLRSHIRTDNSETLVNALELIEELGAENARLKERVSTRNINLANATSDLADLRAQLQAAPSERGDTNFVASTGEYRNPLYEGQFDDETPEQAAHRLHWSRTAMEVQSARLNPAPATAEPSWIPAIGRLPIDWSDPDSQMEVQTSDGCVTATAIFFKKGSRRGWKRCPASLIKYWKPLAAPATADSDVREVKPLASKT